MDISEIKKGTRGIYLIINKINQKKYVGSTSCLYRRIKRHIYALLNDKHENQYLQRAVLKYGIESFEFSVWEVESNVDLLKLEQDCINQFQPEYNILRFTGTFIGYKHTQETKDLLSNIVKDRLKNPEARAKLDKARELSLVWSEERKLAHSKRLQGTTQSPEHIEARIKHLKGKRYSEEHKKAISQGKLGQKMSEETKANMSKARLGVPNVNKRRKIEQYSLEGNFIKEWCGLISIFNELGIKGTSIDNCLNGRSKKAGGYIWKYKI